MEAIKADLADHGYTANTVADQIGVIQTVIDGIIGVLNAFGVIALIAASFGIINTLLMSVQERTREIGLMKAMGMGGGRIYALFSTEAVFIGFLGSIFGAAAWGVGVVANGVLAGGVLAELEGLEVLRFELVPVGDHPDRDGHRVPGRHAAGPPGSQAEPDRRPALRVAPEYHVDHQKCRRPLTTSLRSLQSSPRRCCGPHRSGAPMSLKTSLPTPGVRPARRRGPGWLLPAGLITFGLVPILANALRRVAMAVASAAPSSGEGGGMSLPVILHVVGATVFVVLGALQFSAGFRRRRPSWHRIAGRLAILAALLAAGSGLWLAFATLADYSPLLFVFRLLAAAGMALCIILGFRAIRQRRLPRHRAWMIRAFAIGLGAATQVFTLGFGEGDLRRERAEHRSAERCGLGDQSRGRRVDHPSDTQTCRPPRR